MLFYQKHYCFNYLLNKFWKQNIFRKLLIKIDSFLFENRKRKQNLYIYKEASSIWAMSGAQHSRRTSPARQASPCSPAAHSLPLSFFSL
jgi:hypothetical protein